MAYIPGKVRAICDRCGFEYPLGSLRKEWTGLMVCDKDYDRRPENMSPPKVKAEGAPKTNSRPDNQNSGPNLTTRDDL